MERKTAERGTKMKLSYASLAYMRSASFLTLGNPAECTASRNCNSLYVAKKRK
jgi:hypothetical protein